MAITQRTINRLWRDYRPAIIEACCRHGTDNEAQDACQELFTRLWQSRAHICVPTLDELTRKARNLMRNERNKYKRERADDPRLLGGAAPRSTSIYSVYLGARRIEYIPPDIRGGPGRCEFCGDRVWRIRLNWSMKIPWVQKRTLGKSNGPSDTRHYCKTKGKQ